MFELNRELADQIIFAMEDQESEYMLDLETIEIVPTDEADPDNEQRFVPLPVWQSVDGYNLMERFIGTLHNPVYRDRLRAILDSGRGVFRQFKNAVKERPEIEQLWYRHKEREMRNLVAEWYADVCDYLGMDQIEPDFAETEDLVLSDFVVQCAEAPIDPQLRQLVQRFDEAALQELFADHPQDYRGYLVRQLIARRPPLWGEGTRLVRAEGPAGQLAGFLWAEQQRLQSGRCISVVVQLFVQPDFRGLGIASTLIAAYLQNAQRQGVDRLLMELPGNCAVPAESLERSGFETASTTMELDLAFWGRRDNLS